MALLSLVSFGGMEMMRDELEKDDERAVLLHRIERLEQTVCYLLARNEEMRTGIGHRENGRGNRIKNGND